MLPHLKHLLYPQMIVSFTKWCLGVEQRNQCPLTWFHKAALLSRGGIGGQDNAFNQLPVLLPLLLFSSDEAQATHCCLPNSSELGRQFAFSFGPKSRCFGKEVCLSSAHIVPCLKECQHQILEFYINIGFLEIETALPQSTSFYLTGCPTFGRACTFHCDSP